MAGPARWWSSSTSSDRSTSQRQEGAVPVTAAIETSGLCKNYRPIRAVIDLDLVVEQGRVFAFLGPNRGGEGRHRPAGSGRGRPGGPTRDRGELSRAGNDSDRAQPRGR